MSKILRALFFASGPPNKCLWTVPKLLSVRNLCPLLQLQMLLFPNALCCSLYERNCVCAVTKIFTKFWPANNFCQLLRATRKRSCTSAGNAQAQLHFRDDQQRAFGISNISNWPFCQYPIMHLDEVPIWRARAYDCLSCINTTWGGHSHT